MRLVLTAVLLLASVLPAQVIRVDPPSYAEVLGPGHPLPPEGPGGLPSQLGLGLCPGSAAHLGLSFEIPWGGSGFVIASPVALPVPAPIGPPILVSRGFLYPVPDLLIPVGGPIPGIMSGLAIDLPERLLGSGVQIVLQGFAFDEDLRLGRATDGYRLTL